MPTLLDITIERIEVTTIRMINPRAIPTILRRIDWLNSGMEDAQTLRGRIEGTQYTGFSPGTRAICPIVTPLGPVQPPREPYSLTMVKDPVLFPVERVPLLHPYFAALLRQRDNAKRCRVTVFDAVLILSIRMSSRTLVCTGFAGGPRNEPVPTLARVCRCRGRFGLHPYRAGSEEQSQIVRAEEDA